MTLKKWRPFWSYDVEKTEYWLTEFAAEGKQLTGLNRWTRMFSFEKDEGVESEFQVVFDKSNSEVPRVLKESGWDTKLAEGNWRFIHNDSTDIRVYPSREGILKRNKVHTKVLTAISFFYGWQLLFFLGIMSTLLFASSDGEIVPSPMWIFTILYFLQVTGIIWLAIRSTRKLRAFERKYFDVAIDEQVVVGKTFVKWKLGWTQSPDLTELWLSEMASAGNHLIRVKGQRFFFEKGTPKLVSYVYDFQWKASPNYFDIHKSAGWQLKHTTPYSFVKQALWAKEYSVDEDKPLLTYDRLEKKVQVRKMVLSNVIWILYSVAFLVLALWLNISLYQNDGWNLFGQVLVGLMILSLLSPLAIIVLSLRFVLRMRNDY